MYQNFGDSGPKSTSSAEDIVIGEIVSSPEISPSSDSKHSSPFAPTKGPAHSPPKRKKISLPKGFRSSGHHPEMTVNGGGGDVTESAPKGFSPTSVETDRDTQALVEEDED